MRTIRLSAKNMTRNAGHGSFARVATIGGMQLACVSSFKRPGYQPWGSHEDCSASPGAGIV